ncbi:MAG: tetratricopeptide repeat protein, partial [Thermotogota bacterium]|nr:tetratricopeptide repeat protein [Thermotogota bacterium]
LEEAEAALRKSIETREEHYDAYVMLAEVLKEQKRYSQALKTLQKGRTYKGKDIEEGGVNEIDVDFLMLELLKLNNKPTEELEKKLQEIAPDHSNWEKIDNM